MPGEPFDADHPLLSLEPETRWCILGEAFREGLRFAWIPRVEPIEQLLVTLHVFACVLSPCLTASYQTTQHQDWLKCWISDAILAATRPASRLSSCDPD